MFLSYSERTLIFFCCWYGVGSNVLHCVTMQLICSFLQICTDIHNHYDISWLSHLQIEFKLSKNPYFDGIHNIGLQNENSTGQVKPPLHILWQLCKFRNSVLHFSQFDALAKGAGWKFCKNLMGSRNLKFCNMAMKYIDASSAARSKCQRSKSFSSG